jgi:hypothetical protein
MKNSSDKSSSQNSKIPAKSIFGIPKPILIVLVIVLSAFIIGGGYLVYSATKVIDQMTTTQSHVEDLQESMIDIIDSLNETNIGEAEGLEEFSTEGKTIIKDAKEKKNALKEANNKTSVIFASEYKGKVDEYIEVSEDIIDVFEENVEISSDYIEPIQEYETTSEEVAGLFQIASNDRDGYLNSVRQAISDLDEIIASLESIEVSEDLDEVHEILIAKLENELTFLESIVESIENGNQEDLLEAKEIYDRNIGALDQEAEDAVNAYYDGLYEQSTKLDEVYEDVANIYNGLLAQ